MTNVLEIPAKEGRKAFSIVYDWQRDRLIIDGVICNFEILREILLDPDPRHELSFSRREDEVFIHRLDLERKLLDANAPAKDPG